MDYSIGVDSASPVNSDLCGRIEIDHISILINEIMLTLQAFWNLSCCSDHKPVSVCLA